MNTLILGLLAGFIGWALLTQRVWRRNLHRRANLMRRLANVRMH